MRRAGVMATLCAAVLVVQVVGQQAPARPRFDLLLMNARVIDGTGGPSRTGDVGIRDGRIAGVGEWGSAEAQEALDLRGLALAPGFIDVHTHADGLASQSGAENFIRMGVTSIVAGNCGSSAQDVAAALERVRTATAAVNFATLVGHNTVRSAVMGSEQRDPSVGELDRMRALVFKAMADGAVGFSTGLQYIPGTYAKPNEIVELARVAANEGGIYATHMRNEGTALEESVAESIRVARTLEMPLQISHLKVDSPSRWGASAAALKLVDDARAAGVRVQADQYAYTAAASSLSIRFPSWALEGGSARVRERLEDPAIWARVRKEMEGLLAERGFTDLSWAAVASYRADPSLNGLSMKQVAEKMIGRGDADAQLEAARRMMVAGGASMVYHLMGEEDIARIMRHPMVAFASDAGVLTPGSGVPHPRGYGNTVRVLGEYVRERKVIPLEEAVRKMTSLPAAHFGFEGRGVIRAGAAADLVVFDPATVKDVATYAAPHAFPTGVPHVLVNGQFVVRSGSSTAARPGQVLRRQTPKAAKTALLDIYRYNE
jgi:N-acyl-D-amino-acid deacylase